MWAADAVSIAGTSADAVVLVCPPRLFCLQFAVWPSELNGSALLYTQQLP
jgi:hypothetical protein